jgi:rhodanese-related sulfurtransferase
VVDYGVEYDGLIKRLNLPASFVSPTELTYMDVRARAISRADLAEDVRGINASLDLIRKTRGGKWPTEPVTEDGNFADLVWHEVEFRDGDSLTYAVYDADGQYLGCCYLYPMGKRTKLSADVLDYDVDVSWWVTPDAYGRGYYQKLYDGLRQWVSEDFPFRKPYYSNAEIPGTVTRLDVQAALNRGSATVVDALPAGAFGRRHLPGALNVSAEEIERVGDVLPDQDAPIIVYSTDAACSRAPEMVQRLTDLGYRRVQIYAGGIEDWVGAGLPVQAA